ncbi:MAG: hypothetical protein U0326_06980 [Polyangiales bacterium]
MNTRIAALSLALGALVSVPAFADPVPCAPGGLPVAQPAVGQAVYPTVSPVSQAVYTRPSYGRPGYGRPAYGQPGYAQPTTVVVQPVAQPAPVVVAQPVYGQPAYGQPAYGQPAYGQPAYGQPAYGQGRGERHAAMAFVNALRMRLAQADQQLRVSVARGAVNPQALNAFATERAQIEASLAQAAQDGFIAPMEQMRLDRMTARIERIDEQFRAPVVAQAWGQGRRRGWR